MAIQSTTGYPQYSGTSVLPPMFSSELLHEFHCQTLISQISSTEFTGQITKCGDEVIITRVPRLRARARALGAPIVHDTVTFGTERIKITDEIYSSVVMDQTHIIQICNSSELQAELRKEQTLAFQEQIDPALQLHIWSRAAPSNRGSNAGAVSGSFDLGTVGSPVNVTPTNVTEILTRAMTVLGEACAPGEEAYMVLPWIGAHVLLNSELRQANVAGLPTSPLFGGKMPGEYAGFTVYKSNFVPQVFDIAQNRNVFQIIAGIRGATGFATNVSATRDMTSKDDFNNYLQSRMNFGFNVIQPKAVVAMYFTFN